VTSVTFGGGLYVRAAQPGQAPGFCWQKSASPPVFDVLVPPPVPVPVPPPVPVPLVPPVPDVPVPDVPVPEVPELLVPPVAAPLLVVPELLVPAPELVAADELEVDGAVVDGVVSEAALLCVEEFDRETEGSDAFCGATRSGVRAGTRSCEALLPPQAVSPTARAQNARDAVTRRRMSAGEVSARARPAGPCAARRWGSR
jgi:hypothetical protein